MKDDPRERIETGCIRCDGNEAGWHISHWAGTGREDWARIVAFAAAILAANESWLDAQTPTLEELRAKYPSVQIGHAREACGPTFCDIAWIGDPTSPGKHLSGNHFASEKDALEWLAATLAEITPVETEQQFCECPACDGWGYTMRQVGENECEQDMCPACGGRREVPVEELTDGK